MKNQLLITIVLALMLSSALSASYDYYVYTLENPGTICQSYHCDSSDEDNIGNSVLNIHGLWPNYNNGSWPSFCQTNPQNYSDSLVSASTLSNLNDFWVGLYSSTTAFRDHEWQKHGTCYQPNTAVQKPTAFLGTINTLMNEFFSAGIQVYQTLNLDTLVFSQTNWDFDSLNSAISSQLGISNFEIECSSGDNGQQLYGFSFCINLNLQPMNCPSSLKATYGAIARNFILGTSASACQSGNVYIPTLNSASATNQKTVTH